MLYDKVRAALAKPKKGLRVMHAIYSERRYKPAYSYVIRQINQSHVIRLSDDMTMMAAEFSKEPPSKILEMIPLTRPPYPNVWIEWNEHVRHQTISGMPPGPDVSRDAGLLIAQPDTENAPDVWSMSSWWGDDLVPLKGTIRHPGYDPHREILTSPQGVLWTPTPDEFIPGDRTIANKLYCGSIAHAALDLWEEKGDLLWPNQLLGREYLKTHSALIMGGQKRRTKKLLARMEAYKEDVLAICKAAQPEFVPPYGSNLEDMVSDPKVAQGFKDASGKVTASTMSETAGDWRFLVSLLAILNSQADGVTAEDREEPKHFSKGTMFRGYVYKVLDITAPKFETGLKRVRNAVTGFKKRAHHVRGHFRTYTKKSDKTVWVRPHVRGDRSLGFVHKSYLIHSPDEGQETEE